MELQYAAVFGREEIGIATMLLLLLLLSFAEVVGVVCEEGVGIDIGVRKAWSGIPDVVEEDVFV